MEYVEHGDLEQYLKEFGTAAKSHASEITRQLLEGLVVLHERNICHRDLKPQVVFPLPHGATIRQFLNYSSNLIYITSPEPMY